MHERLTFYQTLDSRGATGRGRWSGWKERPSALRRIVQDGNPQECEIAIRQRHLRTIPSKLDGSGIFFLRQNSEGH